MPHRHQEEEFKTGCSLSTCRKGQSVRKYMFVYQAPLFNLLPKRKTRKLLPSCRSIPIGEWHWPRMAWACWSHDSCCCCWWTCKAFHWLYSLPTVGEILKLMENSVINKNTNERIPTIRHKIYSKNVKHHNLVNLIQIVKNKPITYNPSNKGFLRMLPWAWLHTGLHLHRTRLHVPV